MRIQLIAVLLLAVIAQHYDYFPSSSETDCIIEVDIEQTTFTLVTGMNVIAYFFLTKDETIQDGDRGIAIKMVADANSPPLLIKDSTATVQHDRSVTPVIQETTDVGSTIEASFFPEDDSGELYIADIKIDLVEYLEIG